MAAEAADTIAPAPKASAWGGFIAMCVGMFMAILDIQIVATSLPAIQSALAIKPDQMSWIQTSYLIAEVIAIPLTGWLTRVLSLRGLFVIATLIFTLASLCCALSGGVSSLIVARIVQGFAGGVLIPVVFSAVFLLFPVRAQTLATTIAGVLAVLAPTVGPIGGGWITSTYSWHWLFLVNIIPGCVTACVAYILLPRTQARLAEFRGLDLMSVALMALGLAALEIGLKQAPTAGWMSGPVIGAFAICMFCGVTFAKRSLAHPRPAVELRALADGRLAIGCLMSFVLGIGLYGATYLMPVFLGFVRDHDPLAIGRIMLVTGSAQLIAAPIVVWLEPRIGARLLTVFGFVVFAIGLAMSVFDTPRSDFAEMIWPQALRGFALMFCLLAPIRIALGHLPQVRVPNASGLYNLMRNLGGAIGLALIDTIIYGSAEMHGQTLAAKLLKGDAEAFAFTGLPMPAPGQEITPFMIDFARPAVEKAALALAIADAWAMLAGFTMIGALLTLAIRRRVAAHPLDPLADQTRPRPDANSLS
jgi:MFS transporter, DHA2 family, multidrug resistance protein